MYRHFIKLSLSLFFIAGPFPAMADNAISLAKEGKALYGITSPANASSCEKFAAQELKRCLNRISKADFIISNRTQLKSIVVADAVSLFKLDSTIKRPVLSDETYTVFKNRDVIYLVGGSPEATLYAVYDFLNQLGCQWVAPDFDFFGGSDQSIPLKPDLDFKYTGNKVENPVFKYRKLYVEEGKTHTLLNLKKLIDWMPKSRFNILVIPINYQANGKVKWDNWRKDLIPELQKRGIKIEVGGHGYQNYLNASMESGKVYDTHPEWFGVDKTGNRSKSPHVVICTSNKDAVTYMFHNILSYLKSHPEIDIFDFWPPDSEQWCQCDACKAMGNESDRHAILVNEMAVFLEKKMPNVVLECLAYSKYVAPTQNIVLNHKVLLDFCPINQCFEYQIYEDNDSHNKTYNDELLKWKKVFGGDISIYSYFRKYGWHSLPSIIPHYMQHELKYYQTIGTKGISVYSEPGDWFTYGVNHFVLSRLAWNPQANVDSLVNIYSTQLYGKYALKANKVYAELEDIVRFACKLPNTTLKKPDQYDIWTARINACRELIKVPDDNKADSLVYRNLKRLDLMLEYANKSIEVMRSKVFDNKLATDKLDVELKSFLKEYVKEGVFIP